MAKREAVRSVTDHTSIPRREICDDETLSSLIYPTLCVVKRKEKKNYGDPTFVEKKRGDSSCEVFIQPSMSLFNLRCTR